MLLTAGIVNLLSSYLIASIAENFLAIYPVLFGFIIINVEVLSLCSAIYDYNLLIFSFINLIFSIIFFKYRKANLLKPNIDFKKIKNAFRLDKSLIILTIAFLVLICMSGILAYIMPPLEPDSQTYHFLRAYQFCHNHNLAHFDTNDIRALIMPINSEIIYCWILTLKHKLYSFALLSYFSYFATIIGIWQILSYLKFSIRKKFFAIFVFSSLASVVVEMSCLQTDIVVGALIISSFVFLLKKNDFLSAMSFAIALGVKSTSFIVIFPFLAVVFLLNKKNFLKYISYLILNFIIFSSYNYILNFIQFANPISNNAAFQAHKFWGGIEGYFSNLIHFCFQIFDFTGFTWGYYVNNKIFELKDMVFQIIHINPEIGNNIAQKQLNITTDEQIIGFGILGFLGLVPAVIKGFFSKKRMLFILSAVFVINILILARFMAYMEYSIRFVLSFVCLSSPLLVLIYSKKGIYKTLVCLFCIFYMAIIPFHIRRAPLYKILPYLKENNFNLDKFIDDCYMGNIISVWAMTPTIKNTILKKYPNAKKIGFFKKKVSSSLYLKIIFNMDFLTTAKFDEYDLTKYDLLIFEGKFQDDDIFKDAKIKYVQDGANIIFTDANASCFYKAYGDKTVFDAKEAQTRWCVAIHKMQLQKNFKLDYILNYSDKNVEKEKIYFYTKLN